MFFIFNVILYSILGYIFESSVCAIKDIDYDSGFTFGPYSLIYGLTLSILFIVLNKTFKSKYKTITKYIISFLLCFIIIGFLEYFGGLLFEKLFSITYWDYSDIPLTINKYFNIFIGIFWAIAAIILYKLVYPKTNKAFKYVNDSVIIIMTSIILTDISFSILKLL